MAGLRRRRPIERQESATRAPVAEVLSAHEAGLSIDDICGIYGLSRDDVERMISSRREQWLVDPRD